jgi:septin 2
LIKGFVRVLFSFKEIIKYIDSQFEKYLQDESGLNRRHIVDNRVHCCFYFINPAGHGLVAQLATTNHQYCIIFIPSSLGNHTNRLLSLNGCRLKPLDIAFMKEIDHKVNIVPVIAKADTLTKGEVQKMKKRVC